MLFVTFNDYPGGIYYSQVIDVVEYLNVLSSKKITLVAFISVRKFWENRKKIKQRYARSIVIPMFPGVQRWKWNRKFMFLLGLIFFHKPVICRGIFAFHIVHPFRGIFFNKVIWDARGAYKAEFEEYKVIDDEKIINEITHLEKKAVESADFKIAVSDALVNYWRNEYKYNQTNHVIIPCTLSKDFLNSFPSEKEIFDLRKKMGFDKDDVVIVFSGSVSGWQSMKESDKMFLKLLESNIRIKILLLGEHKLNDYEVYHKYPDRVFQKKVESKEVLMYLYMADYGWLVREQSVTNKVASPVKFAEYLSAGLRVIISENLGDYSDFCVKHHCGVLWKNNEPMLINSVPYDEKYRIYQLSREYFIKEKYAQEYQKILNVMLS